MIPAKPRFKCLERCHFCCIWRGYYQPPNRVRFNPKTGRYSPAYEYFLGKRGTELQPSEVRRVKKLAEKLGNRVDDHGQPIQYRMLPSAGIGPAGSGLTEPERVVSYQLMGRTEEGDVCPLLSTVEENKRSPTGSLACLIYPERPLICKAHPVRAILAQGKMKSKAPKFCLLDLSCPWVQKNLMDGYGLRDPFPIDLVYGLDCNAMLRVQRGKYSEASPEKTLWLYATGILDREDRSRYPQPYVGWTVWGWDDLK